MVAFAGRHRIAAVLALDATACGDAQSPVAAASSAPQPVAQVDRVPGQAVELTEPSTTQAPRSSSGG